jgi:hypothetical protein
MGCLRLLWQRWGQLFAPSDLGFIGVSTRVVDSVVDVDQDAVFGVGLAVRRHDNRGFIKFKKLSFSTRREASL